MILSSSTKYVGDVIRISFIIQTKYVNKDSNRFVIILIFSYFSFNFIFDICFQDAKVYKNVELT